MKRPLPGLLLGIVLAGCNGAAPTPSPSPSTSGSASVPVPTLPATSGLRVAPSGSANLVPPATNVEAAEGLSIPVGVPGDAQRIVDLVDPKHEKPYAGPKGTLKGKVRIEGDAPPDTNLKFPKRCRESVATYGKLFRVGLDKALADALVAVTGYSGFVPAASEEVKATIRGCASNRRTYTLTFGQRLDVANTDKGDPYMPFLDGAPSPAIMVALPQGSPVKLYPMEPAATHYMLRDEMMSGMVADVFVLKYATHDVTDLDGNYEIKGIPVGKVHANVFLPVIGMSQEQAIEIKEGDNTLDFKLKFDAAKDIPKATPPPAPPAGPPLAPHKVPR